jgi:[ribosomal protein S18]-alanine N-acetyltransferase
MGPVSIRAMVEGDLDRVVEIAAGLETAPQWGRAAYAAALDADGSPRRMALVAEVDGGLAGFAVAAVVGTEAELESIAVEAAAQGRGIGRALMLELIHRLEGSGVGEIGLEVRGSNVAAIGLYSRVGFREVGRRRGYYREPVEDAVLMGMGL